MERSRDRVRGRLARRQFLDLAATGVTLSAVFPLFLRKSAAAVTQESDREDDRILVVVQLSGGNDGLSTVVPYADPAYGRARTSTRVREADVLRLDDRVGLHRNLKELKARYDEGKVAIVQGTSYPNPTRSHFESMDVWHTADRAGARRGTGWLGRAIDSTCGNRHTPLSAVALGNEVPLALTARVNKAIAIRDASSYPDGNPLARDLQRVIAMIAAGLGTRVYYVSFGGFDTLAIQRARHDSLMATYSQAVSAFIGELEARGIAQRVLVLTFSEFGRRVKENASAGTDHGVAAPMFLVGSRVRGGVHGKHPSLTELDKGDLAMTVDFRQVYAGVLDDWLGAPSAEVLGAQYEKLPLLETATRRVRV